MSPVDVASDAPDAEVPRLCSASSRTNAVVSKVIGGASVGECGEIQPANAGSGRPGTSTCIEKRPPE